MEKKSKKSIIIGITSLFLVMLLLVGLTYAYYRTRIIGNDSTDPSISVTSKKVEVTFQNESPYVEAKGAEPGYSVTKTFEVKNTGDEIAKYSIILDNITNTFTRTQDLTYILKEGEVILAEGEVPKNTTHLRKSITINTGETKAYSLTINYASLLNTNQSADMGAKLFLRINIGDETNIFATAQSGTLLYALNANRPSGTEETTPGTSVSAVNEARIVETEDDYGISYIYRGNVTNNYVTYSNMCWRIVRIQGDGTIKIVLADDEHKCGISNGYNLNNTESAFIKDADGNVRKDIKYKNLSSEYTAVLEEHMIFANSDLPAILSQWINSTNLNTTQLVEAEWCNDNSIHEQFYYDDDWNEVEEGTEVWTKIYYGANSRQNPTLKCDMTGIKNSKSTIYKNIIGVLTNDEVSFAGNSNQNYLKTNAEGNYWTMTPISIVPYRNSEEQVSTINSGKLSSDYFEPYNGGNFGLSVRPSIVLNKNVQIEDGGTGEIDTPYVIK